MSPNGQKGHMYKNWDSTPSPRCKLFPHLTTQSWTHCTLKMNLQVNWYPAGMQRRASLRVPLLDPQLWFVETTGAVLKSHCYSPLYMEWRSYRNPSAFQGHLNQISSRIRQLSFQGHCSLPLWWEMALNKFHLLLSHPPQGRGASVLADPTSAMTWPEPKEMI